MQPEFLMLVSKGLTAKALADVLRSGCADQRFLNGLAMMLDPPPGKCPLYRLQIKLAAAERPKGTVTDKAGLVAELRALDAREPNRNKRKPLREKILQDFKVSETTARNAIKWADRQDAIEAWIREYGDQLRK